MLLLCITVAVLQTLTSCSSNGKKVVEVKDQLVYVDKGPLGAVRLHTMNNLQLQIDKETWDSLDDVPNSRFGMICTSPDFFAESQATIQKLCSFYGYCSYPDIVQAMKTLKYIESVGRSIKNEAATMKNEEVKQ